MMKRKTMCWVLTMAFLAWCVPAFCWRRRKKRWIWKGQHHLSQKQSMCNGQETPYSGA